MFCLNRDNYEIISNQSSHCTEDSRAIPQSLKAQPVSGSVCASGTALPAESQLEKKMTTIHSTAVQRSASGVRSGFVRSIGIWANRLAAHWGRRAAIKTLHELDDRTLRDIGLARDQIETAIYEIRRLR
jgi:uncharacterized protein YjiS (DUF1127 family)